MSIKIRYTCALMGFFIFEYPLTSLFFTKLSAQIVRFGLKMDGGGCCWRVWRRNVLWRQLLHLTVSQTVAGRVNPSPFFIFKIYFGNGFEIGTSEMMKTNKTNHNISESGVKNGNIII